MAAPDGERAAAYGPAAPPAAAPPTAAPPAAVRGAAAPAAPFPPPRPALDDVAADQGAEVVAAHPFASSVPPQAGPPPAGVRVPDGAPRPPRRTHRWGLGAYVLVEAVFVGVSLLIGVTFGGGRLSVVGLTVALTVPTVLAAATAIVVTRVRGNGPRADLGLVWSWHDVRVGAAYGFGGLVLTIPASLLYVVLVGPENASSAIGDVFAGLRAGPVAALGLALVVVVLAPFCEEVVYRGLLWGALERYALPRWVPFVVTTLLFALAHFEFTRTPLLFVVALPIALARLRTGRLVASVVAHQVNNLLPGVVLALALLGVTPV